VRAERRAHTEGIAKSHAKRTADLKSFIARFGHGHKKMARQAQSRMKLLERIQGDAVELDYDDPYLKLDFPAAQVMNLRTEHPELFPAKPRVHETIRCAIPAKFAANQRVDRLTETQAKPLISPPCRADAPTSVHQRDERLVRVRERQAVVRRSELWD
jgi:hypothetical protein